MGGWYMLNGNEYARNDIKAIGCVSIPRAACYINLNGKKYIFWLDICM